MRWSSSTAAADTYVVCLLLAGLSRGYSTRCARLHNEARGGVRIRVRQCTRRRSGGWYEREDDAEGDLDQQDEPGYWAVEPPPEYEPDECGDEDVEGGFKVPGVALLALEEGCDEGFTIRKEGIKVGVFLSKVCERGSGLFEGFLCES